ncbi:acetylglutamate kinase [Pseudoxanthomonas sangjuensis]|uniref:acetylglutamate kinase n=1 Tax=Pseudoxanthomonas sangjuensis TaxID=1503750 RepID=UPI0013907778|nr:acetylglutamate kinase [Pseudoxanthomonas sangjuensis]KAF1715371.1 acetylglutamate kinase [Pseudoxanthomonas sangjuensis]
MNIESNKQTRQTIVKLLSNMGSAKEIDQYLKRFSELDAKRFAVIKVGGAILRDDMDALVSSLSFLQQVGLTPIVIHGAGPQLDEELAAAGIGKKTVDGLRFTSNEGLAIARKVMVRENMRLVSELHAQGVHATSLTTNVFEAEFLDLDKYGLVGRVSHVETAGIEAAIRIGAIPVIASLGVTAGGQYLNINADWAANELVKTLQPYKIVFLTGTGGLLDENGKLIESINLTTEYDELMAQPWINGGMRVKVEQIKELLDALPLTSSVSMTKPDELAKELFTHRGSGTMLRRGERVLRFDSWQGVDLGRMRALIESSFGRKLIPDYFEKTEPYRIYVSESYRAAMILTREEGFAYLDKFAVLDEAQGEGLGRAVWHVAREENPRMFWRSRHQNQVNIFYYAESDGCYKQEKWKVFWYGIPDFADIARCVEHCRTRPATLVD